MCTGTLGSHRGCLGCPCPDGGPWPGEVSPYHSPRPLPAGGACRGKVVGAPFPVLPALQVPGFFPSLDAPPGPHHVTWIGVGEESEEGTEVFVCLHFPQHLHAWRPLRLPHLASICLVTGAIPIPGFFLSPVAAEHTAPQ
jgi:hypothetical protein